jgi:hypothetical protein
MTRSTFTFCWPENVHSRWSATAPEDEDKQRDDRQHDEHKDENPHSGLLGERLPPAFGKHPVPARLGRIIRVATEKRDHSILVALVTLGVAQACAQRRANASVDAQCSKSHSRIGICAARRSRRPPTVRRVRRIRRMSASLATAVPAA